MGDGEGHVDEAASGAGFRKKLLVIGSDRAFSEMLMSYSLDLAGQMGYSIVAVNFKSDPKLKRHPRDSVEKRSREKELAGHCAAGAGIYRDMAASRGIGFEHEARTGELDALLLAIWKERGDIDLALMEPEYVHEEEENGPLSIPVFCLANNDES